jgi:hypothetical protein
MAPATAASQARKARKARARTWRRCRWRRKGLALARHWSGGLSGLLWLATVWCRVWCWAVSATVSLPCTFDIWFARRLAAVLQLVIAAPTCRFVFHWPACEMPVARLKARRLPAAILFLALRARMHLLRTPRCCAGDVVLACVRLATHRREGGGCCQPATRATGRARWTGSGASRRADVPESFG